MKMRATLQPTPTPSRRMRFPILLLVLLIGLLSPPPFASCQWSNDGMNFFAPPPPVQAQSQPSPLQQWQTHQAMGGGFQQSMSVQQQQATQMPNSQAILTELAVALLRAAQQQQQPTVAPQQPFQQQQQAGFAPQQADPYRNLYGAPSASPQSVASNSDSHGDMSFLSHSSESHDTEILPLASNSASSYGFSVPPADVAAKMRARQRRHRPLSDVERFSRLPTVDRRRLSYQRQHQRTLSLEKEFARRPMRRIPKPQPQKVFKLKTRRAKSQPLSFVEQFLDEAEAKIVDNQDENPFTAAVEMEAHATTEAEASPEVTHESLTPSPSPSAPNAAAAFASSSSIPPMSELLESGSPALLAFSEAERALKEADSLMDPAMMEMQSAATLSSQSKAKTRARATTKSKAKSKARTRARAHSRVHSHHAVKSDFAPPRAVPSSNFQSMFQSIMRSHKAKKAAEAQYQK